MSKTVSEYQFIQKLKTLAFVDEIWLFGSRAREDHQERADIDIAIICPNASQADWQTVLNIIDEADTLLKIDCIRFDQNLLDETLYKNIIKDRKVLYVKNRKQISSI